MRLGFKMINSDGTPNNMQAVPQAILRQGDTATIYFQLVDLITGARYVPSSVATVQVNIPRLPVVSGTIMNTRVVTDNSVLRPATKPFAGDWSVWSVPLTATDTASMTSGGMNITLTDGATVIKAALPLAISMGLDGAVI
jgi:hypothetical protein